MNVVRVRASSLYFEHVPRKCCFQYLTVDQMMYIFGKERFTTIRALKLILLVDEVSKKFDHREEKLL